MIQSLAAATPMSCSTTITVFPEVHKTVQLLHQLRHVRRMQTRRGFVEHVQRFAPLRALQFGGKLDALSLAAGKFRGRLSQPDISQADLPEDAQRPAKGGVVGKEIKRAVDRHRQDIGNRLVPDLDFQRLGVVARALAGRTWRVDARQKKQFDADEPFPLASLTPALRDIERKTARIVPPGAGLLWWPQTACGHDRRDRYTSPDSTAASGRSAFGRPRPAA